MRLTAFEDTAIKILADNELDCTYMIYDEIIQMSNMMADAYSISQTHGRGPLERYLIENDICPSESELKHFDWMRTLDDFIEELVDSVSLYIEYIPHRPKNSA